MIFLMRLAETVIGKELEHNSNCELFKYSSNSGQNKLEQIRLMTK